jgi:hypothetical protein
VNKFSINKYLIVFIFSYLYIGCDKKQSLNINYNTDTISGLAQNLTNLPKDFIGIYKGKISCDDCEFVVLKLDKNNNYKLEIQLYTDEDPKKSVIHEQGKFNWNKKNSTLSLDKFNFKFQISGNKLYYLDQSGQYYDQEYLIKE